MDEERKRKELECKIEVQGSRFGRSLESHYKEEYPLCSDFLLKYYSFYEMVVFFARAFESKYTALLAHSKDEQFSFNESYDEVVYMMKTSGEEELKNVHSIFDLDKNNLIDSDRLN